MVRKTLITSDPSAPDAPKTRSSISKRMPMAIKGAMEPNRISKSVEGHNKDKVVEIAVDEIKAESSIHDRIDVTEDLSSLVDSLGKQGQQTPIIVRPLSGEELAKYEIVAGRRRLAAAKELGWSTIKAFVRTLDDKAAFIAQGVENAERLETSFIERARASHQATTLGFEQQEVAEFLGVSAGLVSQMISLYQRIGEEIVLSVGSARGVGRRRWDELISLIEATHTTPDDFRKIVKEIDREHSRKLSENDHLEPGQQHFEKPTAQERFTEIVSSVKKRLPRPNPRPFRRSVKLLGGRASLMKTDKEIRLKVPDASDGIVLDEVEALIRHHFDRKSGQDG